jgi:hypothetical protein
MNIIQAYYNGSVFVPIVPVTAEINQPALITILDTSIKVNKKNNYDIYFGALSNDSYIEIIEALKDTDGLEVVP